MGRARIAGALLVAALAGGCVPRQAPPSPAEPAPRPAPARPAMPAPPPPAADWRDIALTPGTWRYADGAARFGAGGTAAVTLRCERAAGRMLLVRAGGTGARMVVRTSSIARTLAAEAGGEGLVAAIPVRDPLLDAIAFSRGRFTIESEAAPMLVLPAWAEPARAIEDCRGG